MHIKIFLKKLIAIGVAVLWAVTLIGCFDLGDFSDEEAYYDALGDVVLVYQNPRVLEKDVLTEEYSVRDYFYNKNTGENFTYGDPKDDESDEGKDIPQLTYLYMAIPVEKDLNIESVALFFNATQTCSLDVSFYVVEELPDDGDFSRVRLLGEPEYQQKLDGNGKPVLDANNQPVYERIFYSDPDDSLIVAKTTGKVNSGSWVSLMANAWNGGEKVIKVKESQYILLRFVNNGGANTGDNSPVAFRVTNLLIRAVS